MRMKMEGFGTCIPVAQL